MNFLPRGRRAIAFLFVLFQFSTALATECRSLFENPGLVYRVDSEGQPVGVFRLATLEGRATRLLDVTANVRHREDTGGQGLKIFDLSEVFAGDVTFLGFGKPNVYLGTRVDGKSEKFSAKSLKRGDSRVEPTRGRFQSGILIAFKYLTETQRERLMTAARGREGTREWTCVNATCKALGDAGFSMRGQNLEDYYFPTALLRDILAGNLLLDGKPVEFDVVRTTPEYLETVGLAIDRAVLSTPVRHIGRALEPWRKILRDNTYLITIKSGLQRTLAIFTATEETPERNVRLSAQRDLLSYDVGISEPTKLGTLFRILWGPHSLYRVSLRPEDTNAVLPEKLKAFPQENPSAFTKLKRDFLFSPAVVSILRSQLAARERVFAKASEKELFDMLTMENEKPGNRYNFVVTGDGLTMMKVGMKYKYVDWLLTKHVLVSGYSNDVRFAGEAWKGADGMLHLNASSGTYRPTEAQLQATGLLLRSVFPHIPIEVHPAN